MNVVSKIKESIVVNILFSRTKVDIKCMVMKLR